MKNLENDPYFQQDVIINSNNEDESQAFNMFWPYTVTKGMDMNLLVFNANEEAVVIQLQLPNHLIRIPKTYITEIYDLFILGETQ